MILTKKPTQVVISFSPDSYWLRENKYKPEWYGEYCLTHRIDMSYKGKDDREGSLVMYLSKEQARVFKDAGFSEISGGIDPSNPLTS